MTDRQEFVTSALERAAHYLPAQAPLGAFVHHNTLHVFEHLEFHAAVRAARDLFGARAYLPDASFRTLLGEGRVTRGDLDAILATLPSGSEPVIVGVDRADVMLAALVHDLEPRGHAEIEYERVELAADGATAPWEHWAHCLQIAPQPVTAERPIPLRDRDAILAATTVDTDELLHPALVRLLGAYMDAGLAYWPMPNREQGLYRAVRALGLTRSNLPAPWMGGLRDAFVAQQRQDATPTAIVCDALERLAVAASDVEPFFVRHLLALPGWAGMVWHLETTPHHRLLEHLPYSLMEYMAVRLTLERFAVRSVAERELGVSDTPDCVREVAWARVSKAKVSGDSNYPNACRLRRLVHALKMSATAVAALTAADAHALLSTLDEFDEPSRGMVWQEAYERHHRHEVLDGVAHVARKQQQHCAGPDPRLQVVCCIDDREESLRRHIEEQGPDYQTFGAAGFYGLAIDYQGLMASHCVPLCPASMRPTHRIEEIPDEGEDIERWRRRWTRLGRTGFAGHVGSRTMLRGFAWSVAGLLEAGPMLLRTIAPRAAHRWRSRARRAVIRPPRTRLTALRPPGGSAPSGALPLGYTEDEAARALAGVLVGMGLTSRFAPLVVVLGHGSTSMNNPHEAAHECGACSGNKGGANGRLFAELANHPRVRAELVRHGVQIPPGTWFVGGIHDTSDDTIALADLHRVPSSHAERVTDAVAVLDKARTMDAHERCRRFESVSLAATPEQALRHVQGRAQFHGEPRPEYGHCTNAVCLVGRRSLQRGLFLDRRAFLVSYDPTTDPDGAVLQRVLASVAPVGAGINLEYYFSSVDPQRYGCGTKLPHNVTGLVGVMNGHQSDLRTGLPHQMIDIHEPVRLLTVVEATPQRLEAIAAREPAVGRLVGNRWIQLVAMDPQTQELWSLSPDGFAPYAPRTGAVPTYDSSVAYYRGHRHHLPPAAIKAGL